MPKDSQPGFHVQDNRRKRRPQFDEELRKHQVRVQSQYDQNTHKPASRARPGLFLFGFIILVAGIVAPFTLVNQNLLGEQTTDGRKRLTRIQMCDERLQSLEDLKQSHEQRLLELDGQIQSQVRFIKKDTVRDPLAIKDLEDMIRNQKIQKQELAKTNSDIDKANRIKRHLLNKPFTQRDERDGDAPIGWAALVKEVQRDTESSSEESWLDALSPGDAPTDDQEIKREIERLLSE